MEETRNGEKNSTSQKDSNFITLFTDATANAETDTRFVTWTALSVLSAAASRRVWVENVIGKVYLNLYVFLTADPAIGKTQILQPALDMLRDVGDIGLAPDDMTPESLIDALGSNVIQITSIGKNIFPLTCNQLVVMKGEFAQLMPVFNPKLLGHLTDFYDARDRYEETRRTRSQVVIENIIVSMTVGIQPDTMRFIFPEMAWGQGFMSRVILVHGSENRGIELFSPDMKKKENARLVARKKCVEFLQSLAERRGALEFDTNSQKFFNELKKTGLPQGPKHPKLKNYNARRILHLFKLAGLLCLARKGFSVNLDDCVMALDMLIENEKSMPKCLAGTEDGTDEAVLFELASFVENVCKTNSFATIQQVSLFLVSKVGAHRMQYVVSAAINAGLIKKIAAGYVHFQENKNNA